MSYKDPCVEDLVTILKWLLMGGRTMEGKAWGRNLGHWRHALNGMLGPWSVSVCHNQEINAFCCPFLFLHFMPSRISCTGSGTICNLDVSSQSGKMAQPVKELAARCDDLNLIPGTLMWKERADAYKLSSESSHVSWLPPSPEIKANKMFSKERYYYTN